MGLGLRDVSVLWVQEGEAEAEEAVEEEPRLSAWRCVLSTSAPKVTHSPHSHFSSPSLAPALKKCVLLNPPGVSGAASRCTRPRAASSSSSRTASSARRVGQARTCSMTPTTQTTPGTRYEQSVFSICWEEAWLLDEAWEGWEWWGYMADGFLAF